MFRFSHISKSFQNVSNQKKQVLQDISFEIPENKIISLIGPSGCGKTTFLRILAGFDSQFSGELLFTSNLKNEFEKFHPLGKVGYISQENSLFPWLTVEDNIRFGLKIHNISNSEQNVIVDDLLSLVGLKQFRKYFPKEISGGMKQKVVICRALAINPISNFILMDEPFSALDAQTRNAIQMDLIDIWQKRNLTILFVTHNIDEAVFLSNTIHVMSSAPASIIRSVDIPIAHPRDRTSSEFNQIRRELLQLLHVF
jgi:NitT/TauT family transport system ATP-binding protein